MVLCYFGYIYIMKRNEELAKWAQGLEQRWARNKAAKAAGSQGSGVATGGVELSNRTNPVAQGQVQGQGQEGTDADAVRLGLTTSSLENLSLSTSP